MKVIAVRTDKPIYASNIYGGTKMIVTATVSTAPAEGDMYKLQAFVKQAGAPSNAWTKAGYEQWGKPMVQCLAVGGMCGSDVNIEIPVPAGLGKHVVTVLNVASRLEDTVGHTIDDIVKETGAYAVIEVVPEQQIAYGLLRIWSNPFGATIVIDGVTSDRTTAPGVSQDFSLPAGAHTVAISMMGYETFTQTAIVSPRASTMINATLKQKSLNGTVGTGVSFSAGKAFATFGDDFDVRAPPTTSQPPNPMYKPMDSAPLYRQAAYAQGQSFGIVETATESLEGVGTTIASYTPYILLAGGALIALYALSKPSIRRKATEFATRGGVAARSGLGGARDVARGAYHGFRKGAVEGASGEDIDYYLREARTKRGFEHSPIFPSKDAERQAKAAGGFLPAHTNGKKMTWMDEITAPAANAGRGRKITIIED